MKTFQKILNWACVIGAIIIFITVKQVQKFENLPKPEDYKIDLSYFQGRIYPAKRIEPGTFAIKQFDFEEIKNWGKDAIMTFDFYFKKGGDKEGIILKVWRPDPETNSVFQYSEKIFKTPHLATLIEQTENKIINVAQIRMYGFDINTLIVLSFFSVMILFITPVSYFIIKRQKEKVSLPKTSKV